MIRVYYDGDCHVEVRGHAGYGRRGEDLICAAASILVMTLKENCREAEIRPGYGKLTGGSREIFRGICRGFSLLSQKYPHHVHYMCINEKVKK